MAHSLNGAPQLLSKDHTGYLKNHLKKYNIFIRTHIKYGSGSRIQFAICMCVCVCLSTIARALIGRHEIGCLLIGYKIFNITRLIWLTGGCCT